MSCIYNCMMNEVMGQQNSCKTLIGMHSTYSCPTAEGRNITVTMKGIHTPKCFGACFQFPFDLSLL